MSVCVYSTHSHLQGTAGHSEVKTKQRILIYLFIWTEASRLWLCESAQQKPKAPLWDDE